MNNDNENTQPTEQDFQDALYNFQTRVRGANEQEYQIYLECANDGAGGDITRNGQPLLTFDEWLAN
tara:strand:+ start:11215 stop:11412 length:198 start_codon:yes stop_codon:yes gene_type:complete